MIKILCTERLTTEHHRWRYFVILWLAIAHVCSWIFQNYKTKTMFVRNIFVSGSNEFGYCALFAIPIALQFARNESSSLEFCIVFLFLPFNLKWSETKQKEINLVPSIGEKIAYPYISSCRHAPKIGTQKKEHNWISRFDRTRTSFWIIGSRSFSSVSADITIAAFCYFLWPLTGRDGNWLCSQKFAYSNYKVQRRDIAIAVFFCVYLSETKELQRRLNWIKKEL